MSIHTPTDRMIKLADAVAFFARKSAAMGRPSAERLTALAETFRAAADAANEIARSGR